MTVVKVLLQRISRQMEYRVTLDCDIFCTIDARFVKFRSYFAMRLVPLTTPFWQSAEITQVEDNLYLPAFLHSFIPSFLPSSLPFCCKDSYLFCILKLFRSMNMDAETFNSMSEQISKVPELKSKVLLQTFQYRHVRTYSICVSFSAACTCLPFSPSIAFSHATAAVFIRGLIYPVVNRNWPHTNQLMKLTALLVTEYQVISTRSSTATVTSNQQRQLKEKKLRNSRQISQVRDRMEAKKSLNGFARPYRWLRKREWTYGARFRWAARTPNCLTLFLTLSPFLHTRTISCRSLSDSLTFSVFSSGSFPSLSLSHTHNSQSPSLPVFSRPPSHSFRRFSPYSLNIILRLTLVYRVFRPTCAVKTFCPPCAPRWATAYCSISG